MTIFYAGNQITDFVPPNTNMLEVTTTGTFDSSWVSNSIRVDDYNSAPARTYNFAAQTDLWIHYEVRPGIVDSTGQAFLICYDSAGTARIRFRLLSGKPPFPKAERAR
jgi:hypothetical protein